MRSKNRQYKKFNNEHMKKINIFFNYNLNVFHMLGIMLVLVAIALVMPFIFIYQLVKKWERE